jgi:hypothetical protein
MDGDFEVSPRGYAQEIRLSRALAKAIEEEISSFGHIVPHSVMRAYLKLKAHYQQQIEQGLQ